MQMLTANQPRKKKKLITWVCCIWAVAFENWEITGRRGDIMGCCWWTLAGIEPATWCGFVGKIIHWKVDRMMGRDLYHIYYICIYMIYIYIIYVYIYNIHIYIYIYHIYIYIYIYISYIYIYIYIYMYNIYHIYMIYTYIYIIHIYDLGCLYFNRMEGNVWWFTNGFTGLPGCGGLGS